MKNLVQYVLFLALSFGSLNLQSTEKKPDNYPAEFKKIRLKENSFKNVLFSDPMLMSGLIDIKEVESRNYLISVGISVNKYKTKPIPASYMESMTLAKQNAKANLSKFIQNEIQTETTLTHSTQKIRKNVANEIIREIRVATHLNELTKEKSLQLIHNTNQKELGWWISADDNFFYFGIAFPMPD